MGNVQFDEKEQKVVAESDKQQVYEFLVKRKKDEKTGLEVMEIRVQDGENNHEFLGTIYTRYLDIRTNIIEFQNYGVALDKRELWEVADAIKDNYGSLTPHKTQYINTHVSEDITKEFFEMLCQCMKNAGRTTKKETYDIEPNELKQWYEDSNFTMFSLTELKEELAALGYMKTNKNRNDNTVKVSGSAKKVYSFWTTKVKEVLDKE